MSRGRTAAIAVALVLLISLFAGCSSGSSGKSTAAADRRAVLANRRAVLRARAAAARRRLVARQAAALARLARAQKVRPAPTRVVTQASIAPSMDFLAIQRTVNALNQAFSASVASGIVDSETANYWVGAGVYSSGECAAFETARGQGIVAEAIILHPESLNPTPGWVDPVIRQVPAGRIYQMAIDEIQTLVTTGQQRRRSFPIHVTVRSNGDARLFLRCR